MQVKSLSSLGWFLSIGTFGQLFAALVLVYKLVMNPWVGATTEMVHNGKDTDRSFSILSISTAAFQSVHGRSAGALKTVFRQKGCAYLRP